jgi:hypothetical protein
VIGKIIMKIATACVIITTTQFALLTVTASSPSASSVDFSPTISNLSNACVLLQQRERVSPDRPELRLEIIESAGQLLKQGTAEFARAEFQLLQDAALLIEAQGSTNSATIERFLAVCRESLQREVPGNPKEAVNCFQRKEAVLRWLQKAYQGRVIDVPTARAVAIYLGQIRTAIIPGYTELRSTLNVNPPAMMITGMIPTTNTGQTSANTAQTTTNTGQHYTLYFSGMDPKGIQDAGARRAYEAAIEENASRPAKNELQLEVLPSLNSLVTQAFFELCRPVSSTVAFDYRATVIEELALLARLRPDEKDRLSK